MDLPNCENRVKILRVILADEELSQGFDYGELARMTDGYSGSDLKVPFCLVAKSIFFFCNYMLSTACVHNMDQEMWEQNLT